MTELMPDKLAKNISTAIAGDTYEKCGFIFDDWTFNIMPNVAANPAQSFFMDPQEQLKVVRENKDSIIGVWHSHPNAVAVPSPDDLHGWHPQLPWRYFIASGTKVHEYKRKVDTQVGFEHVHTAG